MVKILLVLFLMPIFIFPQQDTTRSYQDYIQFLMEESAGKDEDPALYDYIEQLLDNPIDLNTATLEELSDNPFVDDRTAAIIVEHRESFGDYYSVNELFTIKELDPEYIRLVSPFFVVNKSTQNYDVPTSTPFINNFSLYFRTRSVSYLQTKRGFEENKYAGSNLKLYNRMILRYDENYQAGVLFEKDPGESQIDDFRSFHLSGKNIGILKNFIVGDYIVEFGQGLAVWSPYRLLKGSNVLSPVKRRERNLRPYTSATETNFMRGLSAEFDLNSIHLTFFYSNNLLDASVDSTGGITSLPQDGFHRTESEALRRGSAQEKIIGGRINFLIGGNLNIGALAYHSAFSRNLIPDTKFDFTGSEFNIYSVAYKFLNNNISVFGEFSYNGISVASINNLEIGVNKYFTFVASLRNYPRNYQSLHANGFGERSNTQNEVGFYTGFRWRLGFGILNFYYDQFKFPYATFSNPIPSGGNEFMVFFSAHPVKRADLLVKFTNENKETSETVSGEKALTLQNLYKLRTDLYYKISKTIRWKMRIELLRYRNKNIEAEENGFLTFQDLRLKFFDNLQMYGRIIFFQTDSYASRVYEFENDLHGVISNPALFGRGIKWYFVAGYTLWNKLTFSLKYSELYKPDEKTISSGLNEIEGNLFNQFSFQVDLKL